MGDFPLQYFLGLLHLEDHQERLRVELRGHQPDRDPRLRYLSKMRLTRRTGESRLSKLPIDDACTW